MHYCANAQSAVATRL